MLDYVKAYTFHKSMSSGRTRPVLLTACAKQKNSNDIQSFDLITKLSIDCGQTSSLCAEALSAFIGKKIGLPVPEAFIVELTPEFIESIVDDTLKERMNKSDRFAFGSKQLPPGFSLIKRESIPSIFIQEKGEILTFDAMIVNPDRTWEHVNCLYNGNELAIIDHELALRPDRILFWKKPWLPEGKEEALVKQHIFSSALSNDLSLKEFANRCALITPEIIEQCIKNLPESWFNSEIETMKNLLIDTFNHINETITSFCSK